MKPITHDRELDLKTDYERGLTIREICLKHDLAIGTVQRALQRAGTVMRVANNLKSRLSVGRG